MPYVEGFGTYPFGEEWLFDAVARSYLPVLEVAEKITIGVTPVLADQLEADGVGERMLAFLREHRLGSAEKDAAEAEGPLAAAAESEARHFRAAIERLEQRTFDQRGIAKAGERSRVWIVRSVSGIETASPTWAIPGPRGSSIRVAT